MALNIYFFVVVVAEIVEISLFYTEMSHLHYLTQILFLHYFLISPDRFSTVLSKCDREGKPPNFIGLWPACSLVGSNPLLMKFLQVRVTACY